MPLDLIVNRPGFPTLSHAKYFTPKDDASRSIWYSKARHECFLWCCTLVLKPRCTVGLVLVPAETLKFVRLAKGGEERLTQWVGECTIHSFHWLSIIWTIHPMPSSMVRSSRKVCVYMYSTKTPSECTADPPGFYRGKMNMHVLSPEVFTTSPWVSPQLEPRRTSYLARLWISLLFGDVWVSICIIR